MPREEFTQVVIEPESSKSKTEFGEEAEEEATARRPNLSRFVAFPFRFSFPSSMPPPNPSFASSASQIRTTTNVS